MVDEEKKTKVIGALYSDVKENALAKSLLKGASNSDKTAFLEDLYKSLAAVSEIDGEKGLVLQEGAKQNNGTINQAIQIIKDEYTQEKTLYEREKKKYPVIDLAKEPESLKTISIKLESIRTKFDLYTLGLDYIENHNKSADELDDKAKGFAGDEFRQTQQTYENAESDGFVGKYRGEYLQWKEKNKLIGNFVPKSLTDIKELLVVPVTGKVEEAKSHKKVAEVTENTNNTPSVTTNSDNDLYNKTLEILDNINNSGLNATNKAYFIELKENYQEMNSNANQYPETKNLFAKLTEIVKIEKLNFSDNPKDIYLHTSATTAIKNNFRFITAEEHSANTSDKTPANTPNTPNTLNTSPTLP